VRRSSEQRRHPLSSFWSASMATDGLSKSTANRTLSALKAALNEGGGSVAPRNPAILGNLGTRLFGVNSSPLFPLPWFTRIAHVLEEVAARFDLSELAEGQQPPVDHKGAAFVDPHQRSALRKRLDAVCSSV
jgi:hypothetical protein